MIDPSIRTRNNPAIVDSTRGRHETCWPAASQDADSSRPKFRVCGESDVVNKKSHVTSQTTAKLRKTLVYQDLSGPDKTKPCGVSATLPFDNAAPWITVSV